MLYHLDITILNSTKPLGISADDHETLWLNYEGRKQVRQYIADVFNDELPDGWLPSTESRSPGNRSKKPAKKSNEQQSTVDPNIAGWVSHRVTKELVEAIDHSTRVNLSLVDKALPALYAIYKTGFEQEVPLASITKYLYDAFDVSVATILRHTAGKNAGLRCYPVRGNIHCFTWVSVW